MSMYGVLKQCPAPDIEDIVTGLQVYWVCSDFLIMLLVHCRETCADAPDTDRLLKHFLHLLMMVTSAIMFQQSPFQRIFCPL